MSSPAGLAAAVPTPPPPRRPPCAPPTRRRAPGTGEDSVPRPGGFGGERAGDAGAPGLCGVPAPAGCAERRPPPPRGRGGRGSRRWFLGPALFSSPFPFFRLPSLSPGVGGTSPASSSLSNREGGKEPPALSCLPANFSGTRGSPRRRGRRAPRPGAAPATSSRARPGTPAGAGRRERRRRGSDRPALFPAAPPPPRPPARASVGPSAPRGRTPPGFPSAPRGCRDFSLCWMRTRAPRRRGAV